MHGCKECVAFWCRNLPIFSDSKNSKIAKIKLSCFPTVFKVPTNPTNIIQSLPKFQSMEKHEFHEVLPKTLNMNAKSECKSIVFRLF